MERKDNERKTLGHAGEDIAAAMLEGRGMSVIARNYRAGRNEIDLICKDGGDLRFVEVKARKLPMEGEAWEAVDGAKQSRIVKAAKTFLATGGVRCEESHFDIVTVVWTADGSRYEVEYIHDAFYPIFV